MEAAGLPTAKGSSEPISSADVAAKLADEIGYPVIIKACSWWRRNRNANRTFRKRI